MNLDDFLKELQDAGFTLDITNTQVMIKDLKKQVSMKQRPTLRSLSGQDVSDEEFALVNSKMKAGIDLPIHAPNRYHILGKFGDMWSEDFINDQIDQIINSDRPCHLLWYMKVIRAS